MEEAYRFDNRQVRRGEYDCWNLQEMYRNILEGMRRCREQGKTPSFLAVDTWGVDFVLLDKNGRLVGDAVSYRDGRTKGVDKAVYAKIPERELYAATGIQKQAFNTIYQLAALQEEDPKQLELAEDLLMVPDYFHYLLTGVKKQEYTNATTTNLVNAARKEWDMEIIRKLGLPERLFGALSMPGEFVGGLLPGVQEKVGFDCAVVLPATHDTGSAFLAVPARDGDAVYLSSGTWSLLGVENKEPITTEGSRKANFTNEGGYQSRFRYLKNIMGLWMLQCIRRECNGDHYVEGKEGQAMEGGLQKRVDFPDMVAMAKACASFPSTVDVDDPCFLSPDSMAGAVRGYCVRTGQQAPEALGETLQCVYRSLAQRYAQNIRQLEGLTGKRYTSINIVGGGCQDAYLNELTAKETGLTVYAGPVEGTALGNLMVQMIYNREFDGLQQAREAVKKSFEIQEVLP